MDEFNNSLNTSVTVVEGCLIVTLPNDTTDDEIKVGSSRILMMANKSSIKGAILDFSMISVLDSYNFKAFEKVSKAISLMGVMVVWVGLKPGVVSALIDLNVDVSNIKAAMNLQHGLKIITDAQLNKYRGNR
ncbi:STAS domain-containing protein [Clostridium sp. JS66]|uniref:STAS domain-containing protein n=1 Tax=Clostridium sp. JS66 TaxID=3064705 RepID=UPI00298D8FED|nr:STAS domain-containing protein [Clostridium sp. JS66]WPC44324.1 STAS domain-containing protein [Clostridium sp. JS66]